VFLLILAELEKTILKEYQARLYVKIGSLNKKSACFVSNFFQIFNAKFQYLDPTVSRLGEEFRLAILERLSLYPKPPAKVRFQRNELKNLLRASREFVKVIIIFSKIRPKSL
jgi:hypothetical protein